MVKAKKEYFPLQMFFLMFGVNNVLTDSSIEVTAKDIFNNPEGYDPWGN